MKRPVTTFYHQAQIDTVKEAVKQYPDKSKKEIMKLLGMSKTAFYNYYNR